jgi:hypothetical protein
VSAARKRLVERGLSDQRLKAFPALQVILLDEKRDFEERQDAILRWVTLPYWKAEAGVLADPLAAEHDGTLFGKTSRLDLKLQRAQARLEQRIALLRHVEALRLYAAAHDGRLPAHLEDIPVPLPVDPVTGKPFHYSVEGGTAKISGSPPRGEQNNPAYNVRFVVMIKK